MFYGWILLWCSYIRRLILQPSHIQEHSMRYLSYILTSASILALTSPTLAQTATATGVGVGISKSASQSTAVAISGQGGQGGAGGSSTSALTVNANTPAVQTINNTGTATIRNVPTEFAPGLAAAGLETCLGSISGGGAFVGTGFSFGSTIPDPGCAARLDARTLWSFGLKKAAVARLCLNNDIYHAMPDVCVRYLPYQQPAGYVVPAAYTAPASNPLNAFAHTEGQIMLVEGKTGKDRLCNDYDEAHQRCRVWANAVTHSSSGKKLASRGNITGPAAQPSAKPTVTPPSTPVSVAEETEGKPK
jgi:hypothetical protein